ncbi:MAG: UPF0280 family protein [Deltaproteobacteria bacterium]|nr:UPF0280 family protein [Deltaproteobacteria bacterium]
MEYQERTYRNRISREFLVSFPVTVKETNLYISADTDCTEVALRSIRRHRERIEEYIGHYPSFADSLTPVAPDPFAPAIIREMIGASGRCGVGPMASVAGAIARHVGLDLMEYSDNLIIENGGDIFLRLVDRDATVGIFAGDSPLSYRVSLRVKSGGVPLGICTSSGTVGHSTSFGRADAVCVTSQSSTLADAAATSVGNRVKREGDIKRALDYGMGIEGILGVLIIMGDKLGVRGDMELA